MTDDALRAVEALRAGGLVVLPTDTVYGLAASADDEAAVARLYLLKGRAAAQPTAVVAASVDALLELLPELRGTAEGMLRALLPGAFTLVVPNPAGRLPWVTGPRADAVGVRVPALSGPGEDVLEAVGAVAATSANLPGGPDPRSIGDVPADILGGVDATVDGGVLPGIPSTVVDVTGERPVVLREGAVAAADALAALERVRLR